MECAPNHDTDDSAVSARQQRHGPRADLVDGKTVFAQ
jgi:hypothetical protein